MSFFNLQKKIYKAFHSKSSQNETIFHKNSQEFLTILFIIKLINSQYTPAPHPNIYWCLIIFHYEYNMTSNNWKHAQYVCDMWKPTRKGQRPQKTFVSLSLFHTHAKIQFSFLNWMCTWMCTIPSTKNNISIFFYQF